MPVGEVVVLATGAGWADRLPCYEAAMALVLPRIGSRPRTFLRTRSAVRALVPARRSPGPPRTVSSPAKGVVMSSEQNRACPGPSTMRA